MMTMILYGAGLVVVASVVTLIAFVYLAPARATQAALNATRRQAGLVRKEIVLTNGLRIAYLEGGHGDPLMLLHGFGGNKDTFTRVARLLVKRYRVIIPDIVGFGESAHPAEADYSPSAQVERLRALSRALQLENLHLGGNSMGGQFALLYATLFPDEVRSLWLLSPAGILNAPKTGVLTEIARGNRNTLIARNEKEFLAVMALGMSKPPFIPAPMVKILAAERIQNAALEERIFRQLMECPVEDAIRGLTTPALVVLGKHDHIIPNETATALGALLPNSKIVWVPDAGHVPMFEKPYPCANDYVSFREFIDKHREQ